MHSILSYNKKVNHIDFQFNFANHNTQIHHLLWHTCIVRYNKGYHKIERANWEITSAVVRSMGRVCTQKPGLSQDIREV